MRWARWREWITARKRGDHAGGTPGRSGGLKGGKARAAKLSPEERRKIAKKAAAARWAGRNAD